MRAQQDEERITNLCATNETTTNKPKQTNSNKLRVFAFTGETQRDDTNYSFQLYTHTHTQREEY